MLYDPLRFPCLAVICFERELERARQRQAVDSNNYPTNHWLTDRHTDTDTCATAVSSATPALKN